MTMAIINVLEELNTFGFFTVLLIFCLVVVGIISAIKTFKEASGLFGKSHRQLLDEKFESKIKELEGKVSSLEASAKKFNDDRVHDRAQSFEIQDKWMDIVHEINDKQNQIIERVDSLAERTRKYELADIRETLIQAHRYYTSPITNRLHSWTAMEAHAFWEQYNNYVERKGNGYIENTVAPDMHKLIEIPMSDYEAIAELMESRHQCKG